MRRSIVLGALLVSIAWLTATAGPALGQSAGTVTATVQVQAAACITINPSNFTYPPAGLSTAASPVTITANSVKPVVTSCSTGTQNLLAKGGAATGGGATWNLAGTYDCSAPQIDLYRHEIRQLSTNSYISLSTADQTWEELVPSSNSRTVDTRLTMPCTGSSGVGSTLSMPIVITAVVQ